MMICEKSSCANETQFASSASNKTEMNEVKRDTVVGIDITLSDEMTGSFISTR